MPVKALKVRVITPAEHISRGRGFYQLEEEELYLPIESAPEERRFFSFLESESVSLQLNRDGCLVFVEVTIPRRHWQVKMDLVFPETAETADIRFLDFRETFPEPTILCDHSRRNLMIKFGRGPAAHNYYLAENLIAQISAADKLVAIWASDIIDDVAGRGISAWRKSLYGNTSALAHQAAKTPQM